MIAGARNSGGGEKEEQSQGRAAHLRMMIHPAAEDLIELWIERSRRGGGTSSVVSTIDFVFSARYHSSFLKMESAKIKRKIKRDEDGDSRGAHRIGRGNGNSNRESVIRNWPKPFIISRNCDSNREKMALLAPRIRAAFTFRQPHRTPPEIANRSLLIATHKN